MQNAEFRISLAIPCQVYGEVLELSPLSCQYFLPWNCETCRVWIWGSILYHDQHTRISGHSLHFSFWTKPWHLLFPVAKLVQGAYCKYQSLIPWFFSKTFPAAAFRKTFPAWRWNNSVITCLIAILANFDGNVKNKCFTSKIQCHEENGKFFRSYWFCW